MLPNSIGDPPAMHTMSLAEKMRIDAATRFANDHELLEIEKELRRDLKGAGSKRNLSWDIRQQERLQDKANAGIAQTHSGATFFSETVEPSAAPKAAEVASSPPQKPIVDESSPWQEIRCPSGITGPRGEKTYWWNVDTMETSWETPSTTKAAPAPTVPKMTSTYNSEVSNIVRNKSGLEVPQQQVERSVSSASNICEHHMKPDKVLDGMPLDVPDPVERPAPPVPKSPQPDMGSLDGNALSRGLEAAMNSEDLHEVPLVPEYKDEEGSPDDRRGSALVKRGSVAGYSAPPAPRPTMAMERYSMVESEVDASNLKDKLLGMAGTNQLDEIMQKTFTSKEEPESRDVDADAVRDRLLGMAGTGELEHVMHQTFFAPPEEESQPAEAVRGKLLSLVGTDELAAIFSKTFGGEEGIPRSFKISDGVEADYKGPWIQSPMSVNDNTHWTHSLRPELHLFYQPAQANKGAAWCFGRGASEPFKVEFSQEALEKKEQPSWKEPWQKDILVKIEVDSAPAKPDADNLSSRATTAGTPSNLGLSQGSSALAMTNSVPDFEVPGLITSTGP